MVEFPGSKAACPALVGSRKWSHVNQCVTDALSRALSQNESLHTMGGGVFLGSVCAYL